MRYSSYKHYVISGHPDTPESWVQYYIAVQQENALECGVEFTDNMRAFYARIARETYDTMRFVLPVPATL